MGRALDLTGQKFGRLLVVNRAGTDKRGEIIWNCKCECGNTTVVTGSYLRTGHTKSCGCYKDDLLSSGLHTTHKMHGTPSWEVWQGMNSRCYHPGATGYARYGGRGIKVCDRWRNSFSNFYEDMGDKPKGSMLERIDNDGDYCPENCKWASFKEQMRNRSNNVEITYAGKTQCISAWEEELGFKHGTLWNRIYTYKWSIEKAISTPIPGAATKTGKIEFRGKNQTLTAHARDFGLGKTTVDARLALGWDLEKALTTPARPKKEKK